ncbi:MAG: ATP-binding protein, partial [Bryobacterales bacterium]|nr:ATP-binding protein [Bryobacterales bacterium]
MIGGQSDTLLPCDERELLKLFLEPKLSEGRVIFPIVGSSGTGKSHVVRWMDAQLRRMDDHATRVVIRIPKGTSLKGVLGILLRDLPGSEYDQYRQELARAQEALDPNEAAGLLCEMLAHTISEIGVAARARLLENPGDKGAQERDAYCQTNMLPALLRNQLLRDQHFIRLRTGGDGVITRLVEQLTEGRPAGADDDRQHLFRPQDLEFDQIDRDGLGLAEKRAVGQLDREDRRQVAAGILNTALDDAKQRLLRLDPTISDLFDAVRQQLLEQKKELVLLVEDFAAVSGMQKQLLQVIIKEAFRDGRQVLCTMRTVIAYTTGYMDTATVLTRANVEYRIPDEPRTDEELFSRIERLVGAYLNAARQGQTALEQAYHTHREQADGSGVWIPKFVANVEQEARATLEDFGTSVDQYELFPFNRDAIRELSREGSVRAGQPVYNPRFVIQNVINRVLSHRDLFEAGQFPPASFGGRGQPLPSRVVEEVKVRVHVREMD